jgi:hypothetical protein
MNREHIAAMQRVLDGLDSSLDAEHVVQYLESEGFVWYQRQSWA